MPWPPIGFFAHTNVLLVLEETKSPDNKSYNILDIDVSPYNYSGTSSRHPSNKSLTENEYEKGLIKHSSGSKTKNILDVVSSKIVWLEHHERNDSENLLLDVL